MINKNKEEKANIVVKVSTWNKLNRLRENPNITFDEIINRILKIEGRNNLLGDIKK